MATTFAGCQREAPEETGEVAYVSGGNVELRDVLGPETKVIGHFQSGERVRVISRRPRWAEVRTSAGQTGWVLQRSLVSQEVFDQFERLASEAAALPSQGRAVIQRTANLHSEPGREKQAFYQLKEQESVEVVAHRAVARQPEAAEASPEEPREDWLLVRADDERSGWLLENAADLNPPLEVAQYREGLRIRAWFEIHREMDAGDEHAWYLWATVRRPGTSYDFDEIRVFVWNPRASRYETSYRERSLTGFYPITIGIRGSAAEAGPSFALQLEDSSGQRFEKRYYMVGRQVRVER